MEGFVRDVHGFERDPRYFESGIPFQPGTSGTPVLDELGNVIGLGVARQDLAKNYKIMGDLPIKVQYALKIENALPLLRTIPEVASKLSPAISTPDFRREPESIKAASAVVYSWK
jgi:S1-C subfamily serine protease